MDRKHRLCRGVSGRVPAKLTYVHPDPPSWGAYQLQWDYQIEWPCAETPKIMLLRYRSYQHNRVTDKSELVEEISENIPVNAQIMLGISQHAAGYLFAHADLKGDWWFVDRTFFVGCAEAAKKRFSLKTFREMNQRNPNPRF